MRIGVDIDGVLADFVYGFNAKLLLLAGRDLFPNGVGTPATCWDWPLQYGYTKEELDKVWDHIKSSNSFWRSLPAYRTANTQVWRLNELQADGHDVYYITSRPGLRSKHQTEIWLKEVGAEQPTVLISGVKAVCCHALRLNAYIDDYPVNIEACWSHVPALDAKLFLMNQPWNKDYRVPAGVTRVDSVTQMLNQLKEEKELCRI